MSQPTNPQPVDRSTAAGPARRRRPRAVLVSAAVLAGVTVAVAIALLAGEEPPAAAHPVSSAPPATAADGHHAGHGIATADQAAAMLATAAFQDVQTAEAAGYASSLDSLGCFQNPDRGGMGVHYLDADLLDDHVDITRPEALVYELDAAGHVAGLVAHEYIVPVEAWTSPTPPRLFGMDFHRHPTLPLFVLHTWLWKANPTGVFEDWNPAVRLCPAGVPVFGRDLPAPTPTADETTGS